MSTAREDTTRLADLLRREHHAMADFLIALAAFDRDRRWSELEYSGLFPFLTRELRLSNGAAQNRKTAAGLIQRFPQIEAALREGQLCLSTINEVGRVVTPENVAELLPRFFGVSARDAAFLAASIRPVENPPERAFLVTPVRGAAMAAASSHPQTGLGLHTSEVPATAGRPPPAEGNLGLHTSEVPWAQVAPAASPLPSPRATIKPLDGERARMNITVSRRLLDKLARARDALSHSHPGASEETILELGLDLVIERHRKRRGIGAKPRKPARAPEATVSSATVPAPSATASATASPLAPAATAPAAPPRPPHPRKRSRHVPADVWRAVWERDAGRCAWPLENGGVCGSTHQLELDHIEGFALGAGTTVDECRILCRPHQDVSARQLYGHDLMNRYTRPKKPRCSEPIALWEPSPASVPTGIACTSAEAILPRREYVLRRRRIRRMEPRPERRSGSQGATGSGRSSFRTD